MGELHEVAVLRGSKNSINTTTTLLPQYNETLLYVDFEEADMLITMDDFNFSELTSLAPSDELQSKITPFCSYVSSPDKEVPDPYYGNEDGFKKVFDLIDQACEQWSDTLQKTRS